MPRIHCESALRSGAQVELPPGAARHVQVLRMQPGDTLTLFDGNGGEYEAAVEHMGRSTVRVTVGAHDPIEREPATAVHLAIGIPANERMDWLVEKATELGAASIQPLVMKHSVVRLQGERATKKQAHWQAVAVAACEQCGRNRVPRIHEPASLEQWIVTSTLPAARWLLAPKGAAGQASVVDGEICVLSGPEGGLSADEEKLVHANRFSPVQLGPRILRAETAPLAALVLLTLG